MNNRTRTNANSMYDEVPQLDELTRSYKGLLLGGSRVMRGYTGRTFPVSDTDIFLPVPDSSDMRSREVLAHLCLIYGVTSDKITVKYAHDHLLRSVVSPDNDQVEDFDENIYGTLNYQHPTAGHLQFVMVDQPSSKMESWYSRVSDLPVYATLKEPGQLEYVYTGLPSDRDNLIVGIFSGPKQPRHHNRIQKYKEKGFQFYSRTDS